MEVIEQIAAVVPYGDAVLQRAENVYGYSKERTVQAYNKTKGKVLQTRKGYLEFRKNLPKTIENIVKETVNEVLTRFETLLGVQKSQKSEEQLQKIRQRVQALFQTLFREYILKNKFVDSEKVQQVLKMGRKYSVSYIVPMYITMRATMIITKQMLMEFLESRLREIKLTYDTGKDTVVMFVAGNFNEENLKKKVFEGINLFKRFTIRVVSKGLQIRVDRESLVENYDKFAVNFLQVVKQMRDKSESYTIEAKKKSRDLYQEVINRIRAKQLEIKTNLKQEMPSYLSCSE